eukprot:9105148-Pyramimonas_sp.AAC.1
MPADAQVPLGLLQDVTPQDSEAAAIAKLAAPREGEVPPGSEQPLTSLDTPGAHECGDRCAVESTPGGRGQAWF